MNEQERFKELWNDYLEGDLDETGFAELRKLMAADDARTPDAVEDFEVHRLLGLEAQDSEARHEAFVEETMASLPLPQEDFVGQVMGEIPKQTEGRVIQWIPNWALSAAAAVVVMTLISFFNNPQPKAIATISNMSGPALWTGDAGRVIEELGVGMPLSGGTLEGTSPKSWVELTFTDGSVVTLSGDSMLTFSELGQKELHLKRGGLTADVQPQERPMLVHTRSATLTVLGTRFEVETELASTALNVSEGRVGIRRVSDGQSVEVAANHRVIAASDAELKPVRLSGPVHSWESDMSKGRQRMYGKWQPDTGVDGGRLWAIPYVTEQKKTIFTTSVPISRSRTPVILESNSQVRVRGRLGNRSRVWVGLTLRQPNGDFAGRFQVVLPADKFAPNQEFELVIPLAEFELDPSLNHLRDKLATSLESLVVGSMWCHTLYNQAKLGVSHFSVTSGD
ncbi:MAG: hypothetical protein CMO80_17720 [Verrucomicrobiales bacterium]|nr:hypothetical protein [Verrucomicrobiales bacterium]|tara:strand:- start:2884 stop:4239 length:1356 start_codon:yes stop_codon:yes gene_type:complete